MAAGFSGVKKKAISGANGQQTDPDRGEKKRERGTKSQIKEAMEGQQIRR